MTTVDFCKAQRERRLEAVSAKRRREIASMGGKAARERRLLQINSFQLWLNVIESVDVLFRRIKEDGQQRALVFHMGDIAVMTTENADYRKLIGRYPEALIGVYNHRSEINQVYDDIREIPALEQAQRKAG